MTNLIDSRPTGPAAPLPPPRPRPARRRGTPAARARAVEGVRRRCSILAALGVGAVPGRHPAGPRGARRAASRSRPPTSPGWRSTARPARSTSRRPTRHDRRARRDQRRAARDRRVPRGRRRRAAAAQHVPELRLRLLLGRLRGPRARATSSSSVDSDDGSIAVTGSTGPVTVDGDNGSIRLADVVRPAAGVDRQRPRRGRPGCARRSVDRRLRQRPGAAGVRRGADDRRRHDRRTAGSRSSCPTTAPPTGSTCGPTTAARRSRSRSTRRASARSRVRTEQRLGHRPHRLTATGAAPASGRERLRRDVPDPGRIPPRNGSRPDGEVSAGSSGRRPRWRPGSPGRSPRP